ncbi:hypothetical protein DFP72DRAFT_1084112 [Ephemerocybe angulata]|uniref:Uncharacterized protein n=1 Tax=Ephemerocybe angulata TaxID=980116 RepID=A0A8H6H7K5_9AGAR|nr:hypothetical protein DFP72DRAFT_1084112 [Tulosesus angulatus]
MAGTMSKQSISADDYYRSMEVDVLFDHVVEVFTVLKKQREHAYDILSSTRQSYEDAMHRNWPHLLAISAAEAGLGHGFTYTRMSKIIGRHLMSMMYAHNSDAASISPRRPSCVCPSICTGVAGKRAVEISSAW